MNRNRGFSILEVLISFTVLTVAILALMGLMPAASRQGTASSMQSRANYYAQMYMDEALQRSVFNDSGTSMLWDVNSNVRWYTTAGLNGRTQTMHVEVTWVEQGHPRRVNLVSLIYQ